MVESKRRTMEVSVPVRGEERELLMADLVELGFRGFLEEPDHLKAYIPEPDWDAGLRRRLQARLAALDPALAAEERIIEPKNWNEIWEASLQPLPLGRFLVKPGWMEVPAEHAGRIVLDIEPRMSFGTGHHESTRLVLRVLPELVRSGDRVLDAGTGSGILAVAAAKLGAALVVAFDIDDWAQENAVENFRLNDVVERITFRAGSLDAVHEDGFDLALANIELAPLLGMLGDLAFKIRPEGHVVLSGVLRSERQRVLDAAARSDLSPVDEQVEGEWWAVVLRR